MPSSIMYYEDNYVVLPPDMQERFVNQEELEVLLHDLLINISYEDLPTDLQNLTDTDQQIQRLIKTACDLDCGDRGRWQWYVVRLDR
jgi:hypothetical protein